MMSSIADQSRSFSSCGLGRVLCDFVIGTSPFDDPSSSLRSYDFLDDAHACFCGSWLLITFEWHWFLHFN